jgi:hypothetical protein
MFYTTEAVGGWRMEGSFDGTERRRYPRFIVALPFEYQEKDSSFLRGGVVVNAGEGGFLLESTRDLPVGTELSITVLYPERFESANFQVTAKIVWNGPCWKKAQEGNKNWQGYQYGLEFIQILEEDRWKLKWLVGGRFEFEEILPSLSCRL